MVASFLVLSLNTNCSKNKEITLVPYALVLDPANYFTWGKEKEDGKQEVEKGGKKKSFPFFVG